METLMLNLALPCKDQKPYFNPDQIASLVLFWNKFSLPLQIRICFQISAKICAGPLSSDACNFCSVCLIKAYKYPLKT
jgi:hypothetical protein